MTKKSDYQECEKKMKKNYRPKTCPICHVEFIPTTSNQKYCTDPRCKQIGHNAIVRRLYAERKSVRKELAQEKKNPDPKPNQDPEPVKHRRYSLPEVNAMAREEKKSYGKFVLDKRI